MGGRHDPLTAPMEGLPLQRGRNEGQRRRAQHPEGQARARNSAVATAAPAHCATIKPGTSTGRMPEKVFVAARAIVTAGFAKLVEEVNQYAAVMYAPTANGTAVARLRATPQMTASKPKVATNSLQNCARPALGPCGRAARPRRGALQTWRCPPRHPRGRRAPAHPRK